MSDKPPDGPFDTQVAASVEGVIALFEEWGPHQYDEVVSQTAHAIQTAALAAHAGASESLIVAALLHDIGHLLDLATAGDGWRPPTTDLRHEISGARYLSGLYGPAVTQPIALHVEAKRYRASVDADYLSTLSGGSLASLRKQGGPMTVEEVSAFEADPLHGDAVALRSWDDGGKIDGLDMPPFESYAALLHRVSTEANP